MRLLSFLLLLSLLCGPVMAESTDSRNEVIEQYNASTDQQKQDIEDRYNERLRAEQPSCRGGKAARVKCALDKLGSPLTEIVTFLILAGLAVSLGGGILALLRSAYERFSASNKE